MRKYYLIITHLSLLIILSCKKETFNDIGGNKSVGGVALVYDTLNGIYTGKLLKNSKIFLAYDKDPNTFIYSTNTDDQGKFVFTGISLDSSYRVYSRVDTGTVKYFGEYHLAAGTYIDERSDSLKLYPSSKNQNILHLRVRIGNDPVSGAVAWVFNNRTLFDADTSAGHVFTISTNQYGTGNLYNIAPGPYHLRIRFRIGSQFFSGEMTNVNVPAEGIESRTIFLNPPANGIELKITDNQNISGPISGATTYFYQSFTVFDLDTATNQNSLFSITSDPTGHASKYQIEPATYYFRSIKVIADTTLKAIGTIVVPINQVVSRDVRLQ
jgi:hypothetical protein